MERPIMEYNEIERYYWIEYWMDMYLEYLPDTLTLRIRFYSVDKVWCTIREKKITDYGMDFWTKEDVARILEKKAEQISSVL